jgi:CHAD domain-containing protein
VAPVARRAVAAFARAVAALQDQLGEHHDAVVAEAWLHGPAVDGADAFALGELVGLERARAARGRAEWPRLWKAAKAAHPRRWA